MVMHSVPLSNPKLGFGLGLREQHFDTVVESRVGVDWFELLSENYMEAHDGYFEFIARVRKMYPLVMHGVAMNLGGTDAVDVQYLKKLLRLAEVAKPVFISDHLCWTGTHGVHTHDLLPVPYTREALAHISDRVKHVQDILGRRMVVENPSTYAEFVIEQMPEWEFMCELAEKSDCQILLDVNNVFVGAFNHGFDAKTYLDAVPRKRVAYMHLAGHRNKGTHIIDTHDDFVSAGVWELYRYAMKKFRDVPVMIEWTEMCRSSMYCSASWIRRGRWRMGEYAALLDGMLEALLSHDEPKADELFRSGKSLSPRDQLGVYVHGYRHRLNKTVRNIYSALRLVMGDGEFGAALDCFIATVPSRYFNIDKYALAFGEYVAQEADDVLVAEVAALERTMREVYHLPESPALEEEWLARQTPESLTNASFTLRTASRLMAFAHPVADVVIALREGLDADEPNAGRQFVMVLRDQGEMQCVRLEAAEYVLLGLIAEGCTLGMALGNAVFVPFVDEGLEVRFRQWFARWVSEGFLSLGV